MENCRTWFAPPSGSADTWRRFLRVYGLEEPTLRDWADPQLQQLRKLPTWVITLQRLEAHLEQASERGLSHGIAERITSLLVEFARDELGSGLTHELDRLLTQSAASNLLALLAKRVSASSGRVVAWESQLPNELGCISNTGGSFGTDARLTTLRLLETYPALARLWVRQIEGWVAFVRSFVGHTQAALGRELADRHIRSISAIDAPLSDPHHRGRVTLGVRFNNGSQWIYKPRSFRHEGGWFELLAWLNAQQSPEQLHTLRIFGDEHHCWIEMLRPRACRTTAEAKRYSRRAGMLLYLAHLLRAVDLHAGNIVAHGSQPVLLDLETLGHPTSRLPARLRSAEGGVRRTGLLPTEKELAGNQDSVSAFGRGAPGPHLPRLRQAPVEVRRFQADVCSGFVAMHNFLSKDGAKKAQFAEVANEVLAAKCRLILRPTAHYQTLREESRAPRLLMDGLMRSAFLSRGCIQPDVRSSLLKEEVAALEDDDVPRLQTTRRPTRGLPSDATLRAWLRDIRAAFR